MNAVCATLDANQLHAALSEVMEWIDNWSPRFTEDDEWPATKQRAVAALCGYRPPQTDPAPVGE